MIDTYYISYEVPEFSLFCHINEIIIFTIIAEKENLKLIFSLLFFDPRYLSYFDIGPTFIFIPKHGKIFIISS